jgi:arylsulfatase A-like enzyme
VTTPKETHEAFFLANLACDRLRKLAKSRNRKPFSLRVDFWGPHLPYFATQEFADMYNPAEIPEYGSFRDDLKTKPEIYRSEAGLGLNKDGKLIVPNPLPWSEWRKVLARNYAQTTLIDAAGGLILDALDALGLSENTIVVWTTDHGDALACHGGHTDKSSYMPEEMVRIPLAIRYPGRIPPGQVINRLVSNIDLAPTLLNAAGTAFEDKIDGMSLLPLCMGENDSWREDLLCETHGHYEYHVGRLVVTDRYKYVANKGQMDECYDLREDPFELNNLIDDPDYADTLSDLRARLARWQRETNDKETVLK